MFFNKDIHTTFDDILFHLLYMYLSLSLLGLPRSAFDNKTVSFEEHIKVEHNMWHYLNFIVLVKVKKSTEFTGPESYVSEMVKVGVICWYVVNLE